MPYTEDTGYWDSTFLSGAGDLTGRIRSLKFDRRYMLELFESSPRLAANIPSTGGAVSTTSARLVGGSFGNNFHFDPCGTTQTLLAPFITDTGWDISHDLTNNDIIEIGPSGYLNAACPHSFVVGTDAAFFLRVRLTITDVSGSDNLVIGFRKQEATNGTMTSYADYATIGNISGLIKIQNEVGGAGTTTVDTTQTWADLATKILTVKVSAAGVVTYEIDGAAPTATATYTFTNALRVVPFLYLLHDSDVAESTILREWECGLQPSSRATLL